MTGGLNEVNAGVHAIVDNIHPVDLVFCVQVVVKARLDVVDNGLPRLVVVDKIPEAWGIDDGQSKAYAIFLDISADRLDCDGLGLEVLIRAGALLGWV